MCYVKILFTLLFTFLVVISPYSFMYTDCFLMF